MKELFDLALAKAGLERMIVNAVVCAGIALIYARVFSNFRDARKRSGKKKKEVRSIVETTSMSAFFFVCTLLCVSGIGTYRFHHVVLTAFALLVYVLGTAVNLMGRRSLGKNWGNNVVIYQDHTLVTTGVYGVVRHPLYASIIWMLYAVGILYQNYLVIVLNTVVFLPFMSYRADQEEKELELVFDGYGAYKKRVGKFFPKIFRRKRDE